MDGRTDKASYTKKKNKKKTKKQLNAGLVQILAIVIQDSVQDILHNQTFLFFLTLTQKIISQKLMKVETSGWRHLNKNKAGYTATEGAFGWAGAIFEVTRPFG